MAVDGKVSRSERKTITDVLLNLKAPLTPEEIEIAITQSEGDYAANIVWEHVLDENLFGFASGNAQKLDNENYLITTVGNNGTSLEVNSNHEIIWESSYLLSLFKSAWVDSVCRCTPFSNTFWSDNRHWRTG